MEYAVVEYDRDEDGAFTRTAIFKSKEEAVEFLENCTDGYGFLFKLVPESVE